MQQAKIMRNDRKPIRVAVTSHLEKNLHCRQNSKRLREIRDGQVYKNDDIQKRLQLQTTVPHGG